MILPKVDVNTLIVFYLVASEGSISAAAEKLFLTQPTVSYHIKSLENSTGLKLLEVKRKKVTLTQAGAGLFQYAKEVYRQVVGAEKYLQELREASLRVGISPTFSQIVASAAAEFEEINPDVKLIVKSASSSEVAKDILDSAIDVGIVVDTGYTNSKLRAVAISNREQLVLVASPSLSITKKERVDFADLAAYHLVAGPEGSATRQIISDAFKASGYEMPTLNVEVNSLEWGLSLVENGKGIGIYHIKVVEEKIAEGRLKALPFVNEIRVGVQALIRTDSPVNPLVERFLALVRGKFKNTE